MNTSDVKSDIIRKRQPPTKKMEAREEQRMKEVHQSNVDTYRFIDTSPSKTQLMAATIHTKSKKKKQYQSKIA